MWKSGSINGGKKKKEEEPNKSQKFCTNLFRRRDTCSEIVASFDMLNYIISHL